MNFRILAGETVTPSGKLSSALYDDTMFVVSPFLVLARSRKSHMPVADGKHGDDKIVTHTLEL